jgi:molybdate transport system permease protein
MITNTPVLGKWDRVTIFVCFLFVIAFVAFVMSLIVADVFYIDANAVKTVLAAKHIRQAAWLSLWTSSLTTLTAVIFAVPIGYILSRSNFFGKSVIDIIVDLPIVFPPLVAGLTMLVFFSQTAPGKWIQEDLGIEFVFQPKGIVICQFLVSASFAIRSAITAFQDIDPRFENVALTLGCSKLGTFKRISLPLALNGIVAGAVLTWARAFGLFGPLLIFVGAFRGRTEVLPTSIFLEQSVGNLEVALAIALVLLFVAFICLGIIRWASGRAMLKL